LRLQEQIVHVSIAAAASEQSFDVAVDRFNGGNIRRGVDSQVHRGATVKSVGTLDQKTDTIHIEKIELEE
jgi:hypothetical protein